MEDSDVSRAYIARCEKNIRDLNQNLLRYLRHVCNRELYALLISNPVVDNPTTWECTEYLVEKVIEQSDIRREKFEEAIQAEQQDKEILKAKYEKYKAIAAKCQESLTVIEDELATTTQELKRKNNEEETVIRDLAVTLKRANQLENEIEYYAKQVKRITRGEGVTTGTSGRSPQGIETKS